MRISMTLIAIILALFVMVLDYQLQLGLVEFLSNYLVVLLVLAILLGAIGVKTGI